MAFNKRASASRGDVGVWHETYLVKPGQDEAIYSGMPRYGLGKVGKLVPAAGRKENARDRLASAAKAGWSDHRVGPAYAGKKLPGDET